MLKLNIQFVFDEKDKKKGVILSFKNFEKVVEILEELYDYRMLKDYDYDVKDTVSLKEVEKRFFGKNDSDS